MGTAAEMAHIAGASLLLKARIAGVFWLMTILAGASALVFVNDRPVANLIATSCYVVATLLVYDLLKPVNRSLSLLAAFFSLVGCLIATLNTLQLAASPINSLVFYGLHCLLVGYLIFRSTFLPRILGVLMAFGGLGWLTFLSQPLVNYLSPYNLAPGILGELSLTLWLLVKGVNVEKWKAQAEAQLSERASHNV